MDTTTPCAGCDAGPGLMQQPGEAEGSQGVEAHASGRSSPDNVTAGRYCQTPARVQARAKGRAQANRRQKPLHRSDGPKPGGHGPYAADGAAVECGGLHRAASTGRGGRGETASAPRMRCRGRVGCRPARTDHGERGKRPARARLLVTAGQARCLLMRAGRGGVRVVVRAGESPVHGEGGQQERSMRNPPGGRA